MKVSATEGHKKEPQVEYSLERNGSFAVICEGISAKQSTSVLKLRSLVSNYDFYNSEHIDGVKYGEYNKISSFRFTKIAS